MCVRFGVIHAVFTNLLIWSNGVMTEAEHALSDHKRRLSAVGYFNFTVGGKHTYSHTHTHSVNSPPPLLFFPLCLFINLFVYFLSVSWFSKLLYLFVSLSFFFCLSLFQRAISLAVTVPPVHVRCSAAACTISVPSTLSTISLSLCCFSSCGKMLAVSLTNAPIRGLCRHHRY